MSLTLKDAVKKMHADAKLKYFFFCCEKGEDSKPVVLADTNKIDPAKNPEAKAVLAKAKAKNTSTGSMHMADGSLVLRPAGTGMPKTKLQGSVMVAVNHAQLQKLVQTVVIGEPDTEGHPEEKPSSTPQTTKFTAPTSKARLSKENIERLKALSVKKHPEVLDKDLAKLLGTRKEKLHELSELMRKAQELTALIEKPDVSDVEQLKFQLDALSIQQSLDAVEALDKEIESHQAMLNQSGVVGKKLGEAYKDEDKKQGSWRGFMKDKQNSDWLTTKYYSETEREKAQLNTDDEGKLRGLEGTAGGEEGEKKVGYVVDQEGRLHQFEDKEEKNKEKYYDFGSRKDSKHQTIKTHHSSVLAGKDVSGAGEMVVEDGKIKSIDNKSGHYKPGAIQMIQTVEALLKQGALLDKEWVDAEGKPLTGKAKELYEATLGLQRKLLDHDRFTKEVDFANELKSIEQAKKMLSKLHCAPSNRPSNTVVRFFEITQDLAGGNIKAGVDAKGEKLKTTEMSPQDFLSSGAGNTDQARGKQEMQKELEEKLKLKRARLDIEAESRAKRVGPGVAKPGPTDKQLDQLTQDLKKQKKDLVKKFRSAPLPPSLQEWKSKGPKLDDKMVRTFASLLKLSTDNKPDLQKLATELGCKYEQLTSLLGTAPGEKDITDSDSSDDSDDSQQSDSNQSSSASSSVSSSSSGTGEGSEARVAPWRLATLAQTLKLKDTDLYQAVTGFAGDPKSQEDLAKRRENVTKWGERIEKWMDDIDGFTKTVLTEDDVAFVAKNLKLKNAKGEPAKKLKDVWDAIHEMEAPPHEPTVFDEEAKKSDDDQDSSQDSSQSSSQHSSSSSGEVEPITFGRLVQALKLKPVDVLVKFADF